jgi:hypothetical protein
MTRKFYAFGGVAIAAAIALTACTGTTTKTTSIGDGGTNLPAAASSALAQLSSAAKAAGGSGLSGALGSLDVSKLCTAVSTADVQKLFKDTAPKVVADPGECNWGGGITVDIDKNDTSKQFYPGGAFSGSEPALSGVGDQALWTQPVQNMTLPLVTSRKGNTDCSVSVGLDVDNSSIAYTGSAPFFKIADADELTYAQEEGQICTDLFKAGA